MSVVYNGRQCHPDFGTFEVIGERHPETHTFSGAPLETGFLDKLEWKGVHGWSELQFDQYVRKTDRKTGLTFGFVAGVHSGFVNPDIHSPPTDEFYILEEASEEANYFAKRRDTKGVLSGLCTALSKSKTFRSFATQVSSSRACALSKIGEIRTGMLIWISYGLQISGEGSLYLLNQSSW